MTTKEKIITEGIKAFNKSGFNSVNLFELAQTVGISRGNLTYHFKDKDVLLKSIVDKMWSKIETERNKARQFPSFENLHNEVRLYFRLQKDYAFIFLDSHVQKNKYVNKRFKEMSLQSIQDNNAAIAFAIELGNMKPEPIDGIYHNIAFISWMLPFYWLSQKVILGEMDETKGEKMIWSLLVPHFTPKGIKAFVKFFGKKYYKNLGKPFEMDIHSFISF